MAKLNQIIALEKGVKSQSYATLSELHKIIQKSALFFGLSKQYQPIDDDGEKLPSERQIVQQTVAGMLEQVTTLSVDYWTIAARKEYSNALATADVVVDNRTLIADAPVTFLLFLEKQLTDLRTFVEALPTLDAAEQWTHDDNTNLYRTAHVQTHRTKKIQRPLVLYPATPEHPAQTQIITEDVLAGYWSTTKESGALPLPQKAQMVRRVETMLRAVKSAREVANSRDEIQISSGIASSVLQYVFGQ